MKILKIDHLGIAVNSLEEGSKFWSDVLGLKLHGSETVEEQKVTTALYPVGQSEVERLVSTSPDGPIAKFIEKNGGKGGFQHVAFQVENIEEALAELQEKGVALIDKTPSMGAGNCKIAFLHPKATGGILVELSQRMYEQRNPSGLRGNESLRAFCNLTPTAAFHPLETVAVGVWYVYVFNWGASPQATTRSIGYGNRLRAVAGNGEQTDEGEIPGHAELEVTRRDHRQVYVPRRRPQRA